VFVVKELSVPRAFTRTLNPAYPVLLNRRLPTLSSVAWAKEDTRYFQDILPLATRKVHQRMHFSPTLKACHDFFPGAQIRKPLSITKTPAKSLPPLHQIQL
jgi:hypothetical protein